MTTISIKSGLTGQTPRFASKRALQLGLSSFQNYNYGSHRINWLDAVGNKTVEFNGTEYTGAAAVAQGVLTADGEIVAGVSGITMFRVCPHTNGPTPNIATPAGELFHIEWDGAGADITVPNGTELTNIGTRHWTVKFQDLNTQIYFTKGANDWSAQVPTNLRVYQDRYKADIVLDGVTYPGMDNGGQWNPHWLHFARNFSRLRLMDWMGTNGNTRETYADMPTMAQWRNGMCYGDAPTKSGIPVDLIADLAAETGAVMWVHIPLRYTYGSGTYTHAAQITAFLTALKAAYDARGLTLLIIIAYSNETWNAATFSDAYNYCVAGGMALGLGSGGNEAVDRYTGYVSAMIAKAAYDVFGGEDGRSRWRVHVESWSINDLTSTNRMSGVQSWIAANPSPAFVVNGNANTNGLINELDITGYFGASVTPPAITGITRGATTTITTDVAHGFTVDQKVRFAISAGATQLDNVAVTVASVPSDTSFTFTHRVDGTAINTSAFGAHNGTAAPCVMDNGIFELYDADPTYTLAAEQIAQTFIGGTCSTGKWTTPEDGRLLTYAAVYWPAHRTIAEQYGLDLGMYEAGSHFATGGGNGNRMSAWASAAANTFVDIMSNTAFGPAFSRVYEKMYRAFEAAGGICASVFGDLGPVTRVGTWTTFRCLPFVSAPNGDFGNDRCKTILAYTKVPTRIPALRSGSSGHRYWRIQVTAGNGAAGLSIRTLDLMMGLDSQIRGSAGTPIVSSAYNGVTGDPLLMFDGLFSSSFDTDFSGTWPQSIGWDFGASHSPDIDGVVIRITIASRGPAAFSLQYTDVVNPTEDDWNTKWSKSGVSWYDDQLQVFTA